MRPFFFFLFIIPFFLLSSMAASQEELLIADFESGKEIFGWEAAGGAHLFLSETGASRGSKALKADFPQKGSPSIRLSISRQALPWDWRAYSFLVIDVTSLNKKELHLGVEIKDINRYDFRQYLPLAPGETSSFKINLKQARRATDISQVESLRFFLSGATIYLDNLRLVKREEPSAPDLKEIISFMQNLGIKEPYYGLATEVSLRRIYKDESFAGRLAGVLKLSAAKGEFEAGQVVILPLKRDIWGLRVDKISPLMHTRGTTQISAENVKVFRQRSVRMPNSPFNKKATPDALLPLEDEGIDVPYMEILPLWVEVFVPQEAKPGDYEGEVTLTDKAMHRTKIILRLRVYDFALPKGASLPAVVGYYGRGEVYMEGRRPTAARRIYLSYMLSNRLQPLVYGLYPKYDPYEVFAKNTITYDWTAFDEEVQFLTEKGLRTICVEPGRMGRWAGDWPKSPERIGLTMKAWQGHLEEKGWLEGAFVFIWDGAGPRMPRVKEVALAVRESAPRLKNLLVTWYPTTDPKWGADIDIWVCRLNRLDENTLAILKAQKKEVWFYVAGASPPYPRGFLIDAPLIETRILPWLAWKMGVSGLFYHSIDGFIGNPWKVVDESKWPGMGRLVYPKEDGPASSLRLVAFRDGMEDYEYLVLLKAALARLEESERKGKFGELLARAKSLIKVDAVAQSPTRYTGQGEEEKLISTRGEIAQTIEELQAALATE